MSDPMASQCFGSKCLTTTRSTLTLALAAALSASTAVSLYLWRRKWRGLESQVQELEKSLKSSLEECSAERQGRIRAQQELRKALALPKSDSLFSYPMAPIGIIQSCFSTRNGTPRQPLLVPLARAGLIFDSSRVPSASLEGLGEYSHCWIIYVFHLNTNLDKLWKEPSRSKFKAKVRVPRLKGGKMGVFATRSPHRPCPIGLTVARVEAVKGSMVLLSGVDLVDGTPVLDVKPYLPYCDAIEGAAVPKWVKLAGKVCIGLGVDSPDRDPKLLEDSLLEVASVSFSEGFPSTLADCWVRAENKSLYASPEEFQSLIKQVLSWDIRSLSQRNQPHDYSIEKRNGKALVNNTSDSLTQEENTCDSDGCQDEEASIPIRGQASLSSGDNIIYHLNLERLDVSYRIDCKGNVIVEKVAMSSDISNSH